MNTLVWVPVAKVMVLFEILRERFEIQQLLKWDVVLRFSRVLNFKIPISKFHYRKVMMLIDDL